MQFVHRWEKGKAAKGDKPGGSLSTLHPVSLLGQVLRQLVERNDIDPAIVDDVITGCVSGAGEQASTIGRWAWLSAGLPEGVPSVTINRACGSSPAGLRLRRAVDHVGGQRHRHRVGRRIHEPRADGHRSCPAWTRSARVHRRSPTRPD